MTDITIDADKTMVSLDVVSLFTAIPVNKACTYIRTKLEHDTSLANRTQLDIDDIIRLLTFVLSNSFFVYNNTTYKQIHGCEDCQRFLWNVTKPICFHPVLP